MKLKPVNGNLLLKRDEPKTVTDGGILIPDTAVKDGAGTGIIVRTCEGSSYKVGTRVFHDGYCGRKITEGDEEYFIIREEDVECVIE